MVARVGGSGWSVLSRANTIATTNRARLIEELACKRRVEREERANMIKRPAFKVCRVDSRTPVLLTPKKQPTTTPTNSNNPAFKVR